MRYPVNEYEKWYIAQGFGEKTNYGYHEGVDLNLKTGGDSDLGEQLLAICNGQITSVHSHTTIPSFGNHLHLKFKSPFGDRWAHYAHCQEILVKEGDLVSEGQLIARVGKSGTTVAHCHFAIKKQPTGIDGVAKTESDLLMWEDPIVFIEKCIQKEKEVLNEQALKDKVSDLETKVASLNEAVASKSLEVNHLRTELETQERDNQDLLKQLNEARSQRDQFKAEKENAENQVKNLTNKVNDLEGIVRSRDEQIKDLEEAVKSLALPKIKTKLLIQEIFWRLFHK